MVADRRRCGGCERPLDACGGARRAAARDEGDAHGRPARAAWRPLARHATRVTPSASRAHGRDPLRRRRRPLHHLERAEPAVVAAAAGAVLAPAAARRSRRTSTAGWCAPPHPAIRAADPGAEVLIGAMSSRGARSARAQLDARPLVFLRALGCVDAQLSAAAHRRLQGLQAGDRRRLRVPPARHADLARPRVSATATTSTSPRWAGSRRRSTASSAAGGCARARGASASTSTSTATRRAARQDGRRLARHPGPLAAAAPPTARGATRGCKLLTQYQWFDEPLRRAGSPFAGWQSGLRFLDGRAKPALAHFDTPMQLDAARSGCGARRGRAARRPCASSGGCGARRGTRCSRRVRTDAPRLLDAEAAAAPRRALPLQDRGGDERELPALERARATPPRRAALPRPPRATPPGARAAARRSGG